MSKSTYPLKLPTSVKTAAANLAKADGVSLNQLIAAAVAEKVGVMETRSRVPGTARRRCEAEGLAQVLAQGRPRAADRIGPPIARPANCA
jgi:hypothetical protein